LLVKASRIAAGLLAATLPLTPGCYSYASTPGSVPEPGAQVRARLNPSGTAWLVENWGRNRNALDGLFVATESQDMVLAAWRSDLPALPASIDTVRIPRQHVVELQQRRLSALRTGIAAAIGVGVVALAVSELAGIGGGSGENNGGTPFLVVPLRSLLGAGR
jgi:hypothetical protein